MTAISTTDASNSDAAQTAAETAYRELRKIILAGRLAPGERLPEKALATQLGVSRTPVRQALSRLHSQGLVIVEDHKRAYVAHFSEENYQETLRIRSQLEAQGAGRAAVRATPADIAGLEEITGRMEHMLALLGPTAAIESYNELNSLFHIKIARISKSPLLVRLLEDSIEVPPFVSTTYAEPQPNRIERSMWQHREIIDAIKARNPDWAAHQMAAHLLSVMSPAQPPSSPKKGTARGTRHGRKS